MGTKMKKSQRKFQGQHLKDAVSNRRRIQGKRKFNEKRSADRKANKEQAAGRTVDEGPGIKAPEELAEMDVSDFMAHGFSDLMDAGSDAEGAGDASDKMTFESEEESEEEEGAGRGAEEEESQSEGESAAEEEVSGDELMEGSEAEAAGEEMLDEIDDHKDQLKRLKQKDPEFFKFLAAEDKELLEFGEEASSSEGEGEGEGEGQSQGEGGQPDEEQQGMEEEGQQVAARSGKVITKAMVAAWEKGLASDRPVKAARAVVSAFMSAVYSADDEKRKSTPYAIGTSAIYRDVLTLALEQIPAVLDQLLPVAKAKPGRGPPIPSTSKSWSKFKTLVKSYLTALNTFVEDMSDNTMLTYTLKHMLGAVSYVACYPRLRRQALKSLLKVWSSAKHDELQSAIMAFEVIRNLTIVTPYPFIGLCIKGMYLNFVQVCKFTTSTTMPVITFMRNCVVEICLLDEHEAYQHGFVYIRQLAIHLRNALTLKKKDAHKHVYNWQFLHSLTLWTKLLSDSIGGDAASKELEPLVYPTVQVALGVISLIPTAKYAPLRCHCLRALITLSASANVYIPLAVPTLAMLDFVEAKQKTKASTAKALNFPLLIKVPKPYLGTRQLQDALQTEVVDLLISFFHLHAGNVGFPELIITVVHRLKGVIKGTKNPKLKKSLRQVINKLEENAKYVALKRDSVAFAPRDKELVEAFEVALKESGKLPLDVYYKQWSRLQAEARALVDRGVLYEEGIPDGPRADSEEELEAEEEEAEEEEEEEEEEEGSKEKNASKRARKADSSAAKKKPKLSKSALAEADQHKDVLEDFELSLSEGSETEAESD